MLRPALSVPAEHCYRPRARAGKIGAEQGCASSAAGWRRAGPRGHRRAGAGLPQSADHRHGGSRGRRYHRRHRAALCGGGREDHRPARDGREPHWRGRRRRRGGRAEFATGRPYALGVLRLPARHGAGGGHRDLRAGERLLANYVSVQQRGGADRAGRQPGEHDEGTTRVGQQETGRAFVWYAGAGIALASARRENPDGRQGAVRVRALPRRKSDDGRSRHRPR